MSASEDQKLLNIEVDDLAENIKGLEVEDKNAVQPEKSCEVETPAETDEPENILKSSDDTDRADEAVVNAESDEVPVEIQRVDPETIGDSETNVAKRHKKSSIYDKYAYPCLPKINCPEKIIFCIDMSSELEEIQFRKNDGSQYSALNMLKRTIEFFVHNKSYINKKHEFSLMVLYDSATWVREFTSSAVDFIDSLEDLNETQICGSCDLASIVKLLSEKFDLSLPVNLTSVPYIIRVILVYGRSNTMFHFSEETLQDLLMMHPLLFMDILYIHEAPSEENKSKEIYDALCDLDEQNKSYIFEATSNITKLHNCVAKFLAHPLQRSAQKDTCYKIRPVDP